jgi:hypothetical protein
MHLVADHDDLAAELVAAQRVGGAVRGEAAADDHDALHLRLS